MSRILLVYGESSGKKIAFPSKPPESIRNDLVAQLIEMRSTIHGEAKLSSKARGMLEVIYRTFEGLEDARFKHYSTRRFTHLLKLCLIMAASRLSHEIGAEDVLIANTLLSFTEHRMPQAMGEFGKAKHADVAARIISVLSESRTPLDVPALWKQVQSDLDKPEDLNKLLQGLIQGGKIQYVPRGKTSNVQGYLIVRKVLNNSSVYVDYSLLKEANSHVVSLKAIK
jgi:hypothetical protein